MPSIRPSKQQRFKIDLWLCLFIVGIGLFGLINLYSASGEHFSMVTKQVISFTIAFGVMFTLSQIPPKIYQALSPWAYGMAILLLLLVMAIGDVRLGAQRWLTIPFIGSVQPSEIAKIATPMMVAWFLADRPNPPKFVHVVMALFIIAVPFVLVAEQPDLGTGMLVFSGGIFVLFFAQMSWKIIVGFIIAFVSFVPIAWQFLLHDYQRQRVMTLLDPSKDALGSGWNILQSTAAIGSGGIWGKGYLNGTQSHLNFLPESHTDFAIAAFSEEFGVVGVGLLLIFYTALIFRIFQIAHRTKNRYQRLLVSSIAMSFATYVFINMGMVAGILPVVGVPLPFVSYGGTALIMLMAGMGIVMSVYAHQHQS